ncbi:MAG: Rho termination factor N-terminal domain-containing protein [Candidatus Sericytochromatia bacterium]|nr:Rho termination factor N-terminal domain-containing protein [Candidatus Sericytochromatia bacterium]
MFGTWRLKKFMSVRYMALKHFDQYTPGDIIPDEAIARYRAGGHLPGLMKPRRPSIRAIRIDDTVPPPTTETPNDGLEDMTVSELRELAAEKGLTGYTKLRKDKLIDELRHS